MSMHFLLLLLWVWYLYCASYSPSAHRVCRALFWKKNLRYISACAPLFFFFRTPWAYHVCLGAQQHEHNLNEAMVRCLGIHSHPVGPSGDLCGFVKENGEDGDTWREDRFRQYVDVNVHFSSFPHWQFGEWLETWPCESIQMEMRWCWKATVAQCQEIRLLQTTQCFIGNNFTL